MGKYFDKFPKVYYSLDDNYANPQIVTDVTFPVHLLEPYASDARFYYTYIVKDGLKPEDVAHLVYGDVQLHWVILHFNKIIDPRYEWPLSSVTFDKYILDKYGSVAAAQSEVKIYYKTISMTSSLAEAPYTQKLEIGAAEYANVVIDLAGNSYSLANSETVLVKTNRETISSYDWELQQNEARREIKLIQRVYVDQIRKSFNELTR